MEKTSIQISATNYSLCILHVHLYPSAAVNKSLSTTVLVKLFFIFCYHNDAFSVMLLCHVLERGVTSSLSSDIMF